MFAFERAWIHPVLSGFAPEATREGLVPREGEVDYVRAFHLMRNASTPLAQLGIRIALFMAATAPLWMTFRFKTMAGLRQEQRAPILSRMLEHKVFFVRELTMLLKIGASFALVGTPSIRARANVDLPKVQLLDEPESDSGIKPRKLPVLPPPTQEEEVRETA